MAKIFKLSMEQKELLKNGAILGTWKKEGSDTLKNTIAYTDLTELKKANELIDAIKNSVDFKNQPTNNEKNSYLKKAIINSLSDGHIKNIALLLVCNLKKTVTVPKTTLFKLAVKTFNFSIKIVVLQSVVTCLGNETFENVVYEFETNKDYINEDDLIGCKFSDEVIPILKDFMIGKKELGTSEAVSKSNTKSYENIDEIKSDILYKLDKFMCSYNIKFITK